MFEKVISYFRCCAVCGRSSGQIEWLCCLCENQLFEHLNPKSQWIDSKIKHYYLFPWAQKDQFMSKVVYSLKGAGLNSSYQMLSQLMKAHFPKHSQLPLFYPSKGKKDHAHMLAQNIKGEAAIAIIKKVGKKQALLNLQKRAEVEFFKSHWRGSKALLVDDVLTTGATAKACYKALNQPSELTVWSLFYRKSL